MKLILVFFLLTLALAAHDNLLTLSRSHSCIKEVVAQFILAQNCSMLLDSQKSQLALKMSQCLLSSMGKQFPVQCENSQANCKLEGDAWSTFSTFYAHIDNLCHFYWEMLHHERAERLIGQLSQSSSNAEKVLRQNIQGTHKILSMQHLMHLNIEDSLRSQQQMTFLINDSALLINNITNQIQTFVQRLHQDINQNYASLHGILNAINQGINHVVELQGYLKAEITSINGMLYFLIQFLLILFFTSFQKNHGNRNYLLAILAVQVFFQLILSKFISNIIGIKYFRCIFIIFMIMAQVKSKNKIQQIDLIIANHFNTPRLEKAIAKAMHNKVYPWNQQYMPYYKPYKQTYQPIEEK